MTGCANEKVISALVDLPGLDRHTNRGARVFFYCRTSGCSMASMALRWNSENSR